MTTFLRHTPRLYPYHFFFHPLSGGVTSRRQKLGASLLDYVTRNALTARKNEAYGLRKCQSEEQCGFYFCLNFANRRFCILQAQIFHWPSVSLGRLIFVRFLTAAFKSSIFCCQSQFYMMSFGGIGFLMRNSQAAMSAVFKSRFFSSGKTENSKPLLTKIKSHNGPP